MTYCILKFSGRKRVWDIEVSGKRDNMETEGIEDGTITVPLNASKGVMRVFES